MAQKNFADAMNQIVNGTNGLKSQINVKADKHSPALKGTPTAPTPDNDTDSGQIATTEFVQNLIRRLVSATPETIETLYNLTVALTTNKPVMEAVVQELDKKLNKTDAATTYATKDELSDELSNVSVDTTNLAKLDAKNTFTKQQTLPAAGLKIGNCSIKDGVDFIIQNDDANCYHKFVIEGNSMVIGNGSGNGGYVVSMWLNFANSNLLQIKSAGSDFFFKSDGIYLGNTKIA